MRIPPLSRWIPALVWAAVLLWLGRRPPEAVPSGPAGFDKLLHAGAYGLLGFLAGWAARRKGLLWGAGAALLVGAIDEWGQASVRGRYPDLLDLAADVVGGAIGGWIGAQVIARSRS